MNDRFQLHLIIDVMQTEADTQWINITVLGHPPHVEHKYKKLNNYLDRA